MSIKKALEILNLFNLETRELTVTQISNLLHIPQSSVYRYIRILKENRYVFETERNSYKIGFKLLELGNLARIDNEIISIANPIMKQLTDETKETSVLVIHSGLNAVCLEDVTSSHHLIKVSSVSGKVIPLFAGASSKAILAYMGSETINKLYKHGFIKKFTPHTIVDKEELIKEMKKVRENGYAVSDSELDEGVYTYAVPIFSSGNIFGSLSLAGPKERIIRNNKEELIEKIKNAVNEIEKNL
ncbi:IclR family transcriptional regulator [Halalkalibacter oceani]|uniref:IclR family transcriptional regulator n=1 Tax=Halalkalibacter oceani TaxID=1653776 RepID=A0A9X2DP04_9BACI|nr:IclR family transcriptional regulator [Halalkalibacter oceani]MCM3714429.1 IclR family transcriptional regulator [Halalkalibacter oceani]